MQSDAKTTAVFDMNKWLGLLRVNLWRERTCCRRDVAMRHVRMVTAAATACIGRCASVYSTNRGAEASQNQRAGAGSIAKVVLRRKELKLGAQISRFVASCRVQLYRRSW